MRQRLSSAASLAAAVTFLVLLDPLRGLPPGDLTGWVTAAPEQALGVLAACAAWAFALWLAVVLGLAVMVQTLAPTSRCAHGAARVVASLVPRAMRPLLRPVLGVALGGAIVLGPAGAALAAGAAPSPAAAVSVAPTVTPPGPVPGITFVPSAVPPPIVAPPAPPLPLLDWVTPPTAPPTPAPSASPPPPSAAPDSAPPTAPATRRHTVVSGDTLWGVATGQLPADASAAAITAAWQEIYAANRGVVGPDPSFLLPGEVLVVGDPS